MCSRWVAGGILSCALLLTPVRAQTPPREPDALVDAVVREPDLRKKQDYLERWLAQEPQEGTDKIIDAAKRTLAESPHDFAAQYTLVALVPWQMKLTSETLLLAASTAERLLSHGMEIRFAADNKPAGVSADDWEQDRLRALGITHRTLGWIAMQRRDHAAAEQHFLESLKIYPNSPLVSAWLGRDIMTRERTDKTGLALFSLARAAAYEGDGKLPDRARKNLDEVLSKEYIAYTGTSEGLDALKAAAKTQPLPSSGFVIDSAAAR